MYDQYQDWRLDVDNMTYEVPSFCIYQSCKAVCRGESPLLTFSFDRNCSILRIEWDMRVQGCARMRSSEALGWSNTRHSTPTIFQQKWIGDVASAKYTSFFLSIVFFSFSLRIGTGGLICWPFCYMFQEEFEADEEIGKLSCGHNYHVQCIKQWLSRKNSCPVCKTAVSKT
jgi:hypothetical protein